jgi:lipopolysaccharide/colanic/teichoic acid biosynthesis glycosyltransferase
MKRAFDVLVSAAVLVVFSPLLLVVAATIVLDSGLPVFFAQERLGRGLRPFRMWKFRTMAKNNSGPRLTVAGDVRVTRVGRWLRLTKFDEFPQFANVLLGHMSIVGPRPEIPELAGLYEDRFRKVLVLRPGITDEASTIFRNEEEILSRSTDPIRTYRETILPAKLDLAESYLEKHSVACDLLIILRTLVAIIHPANAVGGHQPAGRT